MQEIDEHSGEAIEKITVGEVTMQSFPYSYSYQHLEY